MVSQGHKTTSKRNSSTPAWFDYVSYDETHLDNKTQQNHLCDLMCFFSTNNMIIIITYQTFDKYFHNFFDVTFGTSTFACLPCKEFYKNHHNILVFCKIQPHYMYITPKSIIV